MPGGRSTVDESLFASKDSKKSNKGPAAAAGGLVISRGELAKIKQMGVIETYSQKQERAAKARAAREAKMQKAQLRKKRMIEKEKEAKKHRVKSDIEIIKEAEANALLNNASKMMEDVLDRVLSTYNADSISKQNLFKKLAIDDLGHRDIGLLVNRR